LTWAVTPDKNIRSKEEERRKDAEIIITVGKNANRIDKISTVKEVVEDLLTPKS
jgi:hypothetical protein